jgi:Lar family restriction alleviation protein
MEEQLLRPCPFCNSIDAHMAEQDGLSVLPEYKFFVNCPDCWTHGPLAKTESEAERQWNDRLSDVKPYYGDSA